MALPATLDADDPAGSAAASTIDNEIRAFKLWVEDVFGLADDVAVAAALGSITAPGLQYWTFQDAAGNPGAAGRLQRNSDALMFHDGTSAKTVAMLTSTQTLTNKILVPAAVSGTPVAHALYRDNVCKGWAYISWSGGTPTLGASYNVDSITDAGTGLITVTWDRDFTDTLYAVVAIAGDSSGIFIVTARSQTVGAVTLNITTAAGVSTDPARIMVIAFGAQ